MRLIESRRGALLQRMLVEILLVAAILLLFLGVIYERTDSGYVKQQILEKQVALLLDAAEPGMEFVLSKQHDSGIVQDVRVEHGRVFIAVDRLESIKGYPYYSRYGVVVREQPDSFIIEVNT